MNNKIYFLKMKITIRNFCFRVVTGASFIRTHILMGIFQYCYKTGPCAQLVLR